MFVIKIMPYGWYTGISGKYHDMFQCSAKQFAMKFENKQDAEKVAKPLIKVGYDVEIIELKEQ